MEHHLSWILLSKVLIRAHVAPFQTKLSPDSSGGPPPPFSADRGDPTSAWCFPPTKRQTAEQLTWYTTFSVDPFSPEGWN